MKRLQEQQETIMYLSRLLHNHTRKGDAEKRTLVFTSPAKHLNNSKYEKEIIYKNVHRTLYEKLKPHDNIICSMFIASDVEASRQGYIPNDVLLKPFIPHYHGVIVFHKHVWDRISENLSYWQDVISSSMSEVLDDEDVDDDNRFKKSIWIDQFDESKVRYAKHRFPLGNYTSYAMKTHLQANNRGIMLHEPSVFPFDIYNSDEDTRSANRLFNDLWKQQVSYNKSHKYLILRR